MNKGNEGLSENSLKVLEYRYFIKDKNGKPIENWEQLCRRVAKAIAKDEKTPELQKEWEEKYFELIFSRRFIPNTPTLINAGKDNNEGWMACYVIPIEDSMESIFQALKEAALIMKSGGGVGYNFSDLRPKNSQVSSTGNTASGPISFAEVFDKMVDVVKQGGVRRGAQMFILDCDHPDIMEFIDCKNSDLSRLTNFNISVSVTDEFMDAVKKDKEYELKWGGKVYQKVKAKKVFDKIVKNAYQTGEPGLFFKDSINKVEAYSLIDNKNIIRSCNPCGEVSLTPYTACTLGSFDINKYLEGEKFFDKNFERDIEIATRLLDSVVEMNPYAIKKIEIEHKKQRKIGLGIMGLADLFCNLDIKYGSAESIALAGSFQKTLIDTSHKASLELGKEKGVCQACQEIAAHPDFKDFPQRRNLWTTIIAPTGSISLIGDCSSGIEPNFANAYIRTCMDNTQMIMLNPVFQQKLNEAGIELTDQLKDKIISSMSIKDIKEIPKKIRDIFVTAADVTMEEHVTMQAAFQKYVDGAVSKTINLVQSAKLEDVEKAYLLAYELGCKGITVYRDGSRPNQVLSTKKEEKKKFSRPTRLKGETEVLSTNFGNLYVTFNYDGDSLKEVFLNIGNCSGDVHSFIVAIGKLISIQLQEGVPIKKIAKNLKGISGEDIIFHDKKKYTSIPDFLAKRMLEAEKEQEVEKEEKTILVCPEPDCGQRLYKAEGCYKCLSCGYSKC